MDIDPIRKAVIFNAHENRALGLEMCEGLEWLLPEDAPELLSRAEEMYAKWTSPQAELLGRNPRSAALWAKSVYHAMDAVVYLEASRQEITIENVRGTKLFGLDKDSALNPTN